MTDSVDESCLSFKNDILPFFRPGDIQCMSFRRVQLDSLESVRKNANLILDVLEEGFMPPDAPWPPERISIFRTWVDQGMMP
jgi:hypothetical protein